MLEHNHIVISLGGSLLITKNGIEVDFLRRFANLVREDLKKGRKFVIVVGGGETARTYQNALKQITLESDPLDYVGIQSAQLNAELAWGALSDVAYPEVVLVPGEVPNHELVIAGPTRIPGRSTDYCSVSAAKVLGVKRVINLSGAHSVYDSDPAKNPNALKLDDVSWEVYRSCIPQEWNPGLKTPFDPIASSLAEESGIEVVVLGDNLEDFEQYLQTGEISGTLIHS